MGKGSRYIIDFCLYHNINISYIIDDDENKQGKFTFNNIVEYECISYSQLIQINNLFKNNDLFGFIITSAKYLNEIKEILINIGIPVKNIYYFDPYFSVTCWNFTSDYDIYRDYLLRNIEKINIIYDYLSDDYSKQTLLNVIKGRLTCDYQYFKEVYTGDQYYNKDVIQFSDEETVIELGSYNGKTILEFLEIVNRKYKKFICFEPNYNIHLLNIIYNENLIGGGGIIELYHKGAYSISDTFFFNDNKKNAALSKIVKNSDERDNIKIEVVALDDIIKDDITFIKADIEGSELMALKGAKNVIKKSRPKLAICIYHKHEDILDLFEYISSLNLNYKYYLRHHSFNCA